MEVYPRAGSGRSPAGLIASELPSWAARRRSALRRLGNSDRSGMQVTDEGGLRPGQLALAISNAVVQELAGTTGRGPTHAKTTVGDNGVFVVLQDTLTRGERTLVAAGESEAVLDLRRRWQRVMRDSCSRKVEQLTGRKVIGFMS